MTTHHHPSAARITLSLPTTPPRGDDTGSVHAAGPPTPADGPPTAPAAPLRSAPISSASGACAPAAASGSQAGTRPGSTTTPERRSGDSPDPPSTPCSSATRSSPCRCGPCGTWTCTPPAGGGGHNKAGDSSHENRFTNPKLHSVHPGVGGRNARERASLAQQRDCAHLPVGAVGGDPREQVVHGHLVQRALLRTIGRIAHRTSRHISRLSLALSHPR